MRKRAHAALAESFSKGGDSKEVAETIVKIIESPSPQLHYVVGKEKPYVFMKRILPVSMMESQTRKHWRLDG